MKIHLHIGYPKTGTTALQAHIFSNTTWLAERGVYIPKTGYVPIPGHCYLFGSKNDKKPKHPVSGFIGEVDKIEELKEEILRAEQDGFDAVLMTSEMLSLIDRDMIERLYAGLKSFDVTLYVYVKSQASLANDGALQAIKAIRTKQTLFELEQKIESKPYQYFHNVLSTWKDVFKNNIEIKAKAYKRALLVEQDIVTDFFNWMGHPPDGSFLFQENEQNSGLSIDKLALMAFVKKCGARPDTMKKLSLALQSTDDQFESGKSIINPEDFSEIQELFELENQKLITDFGLENLEPAKGLDFLHGTHKSIEKNKFFRFFEDGVASLVQPQASTFYGQIQSGLNLIPYTSWSGDGWSAADHSGIWTIGPVSQVKFRVPKLPASFTGKFLRLGFMGQYADGILSTQVMSDGHTIDAQMSGTQIFIKLNQNRLDNGVELTLKHDVKGALQRRALKLTLMAYDIVDVAGDLVL